jgi:hypothetical protein
MSSPAYRYSLVACARWETDAIVEWLTYHRAIGFEHVFLYCNDDDPIVLYEKILPFGEGFVTFLHYPFVGQQYLMYRHFLLHQKHKTEWFQILDIDEFLYLGPHRSIADYMQPKIHDHDSIYFNWVAFGASGHQTRPTGSVLRNFTRRCPNPDAHTKTMTRSSAIRTERLDAYTHYSLHHHWPVELLPSAKFNILGAPMDEYWHDFPFRARPYVLEPAHRDAILAGPCIFHYFVKSEQDFHRRRERSISADFANQGNWARMLDDGQAAALFAHLDEVHDDRLARFWTEHLARAPRLLDPPGAWPNVAIGKQADQSSISPFSRGATTREDAAGAVTGRPTGEYGFHTDEEDRPWWSVDLGAACDIALIRIFNRFDHRAIGERFREFDLQASADGQDWDTIAAVRGDRIWGGIDGDPYLFQPDLPPTARHVRIILAGRGILHLDQVEIYGEPHSPET